MATQEYKILNSSKSVSLQTTILISLLIVFLVWFIQYNWNRRQLYMYSLKLPGPIALPLIGSVHLLLGSNETVFRNTIWVCEKFGTPSRVWQGPLLFTFIAEPKDLEVILTKNVEKDDVYRLLRPLIGDGLLSGPSHIWRVHRKIIAPTFNQRVLDTYVEVFAETSETLRDVLKDQIGKKIDIFSYVNKCTLDTICQTALGVKMDAQRVDSRYVELAHTLFSLTYQRVLKFWLHPDIIYWNTPAGKNVRSIVKEMQEFTLNVLMESKRVYYKKKEERKNLIETAVEETSIIKRKTFSELLIELSDQGANFSDQELREEVDTVIITGSDTTANTLSYVFLIFGLYPEVQEKVFAEVLDVIGPTRTVLASDLSLFPYMERVIKESLRIFPVVPNTARKLTEDMQLDSGLVMPKGSSVVIPLMFVHRNPKYWPDPLKFDPDRFLPEECAKRHPYCYIPFSAGSRNCIGKTYGMMAVKTMLATLIREYVFHTEYKSVEEIRLTQDIVMLPVEGFKVSISNRTNCK